MKSTYIVQLAITATLVLQPGLSTAQSNAPKTALKSEKDIKAANDAWMKPRAEMDLNKDGKIDAEEAKAYREKLTKAAVHRVEVLESGKPLTLADVKDDPSLRETFKRLDKNKDGKVSKNELTKKPLAKPTAKTAPAAQESSKTPVWKKKAQ